MVDAFFTTYLVWPDNEPVRFLLYMLGVITYGIWSGIKDG